MAQSPGFDFYLASPEKFNEKFNLELQDPCYIKVVGCSKIIKEDKFYKLSGAEFRKIEVWMQIQELTNVGGPPLWLLLGREGFN